MWGKYDIYLNNEPVVQLKDEGFFIKEVAPGNLVISSFVSNEKEYMAYLNLNVEEDQVYYIQLVSTLPKFGVVDLFSGILSISTIISGYKAQMKIESGQGSLKDIIKVINSNEELQGLDLKSNKEIENHALLLMEGKTAENTLKKCCSSKNVDTSVTQEKLQSFKKKSYIEKTPSILEQSSSIKKICSNKKCLKQKKFKAAINPTNAFVMDYEIWKGAKKRFVERAIWRHFDDTYEIEFIHHLQNTTVKLRSHKEGFAPKDWSSYRAGNLIDHLIYFSSILPLNSRGVKLVASYVSPLSIANNSIKARKEIEQINKANANNERYHLKKDVPEKLEKLSKKHVGYSCNTSPNFIGTKDCSLTKYNLKLELQFSRTNLSREEYIIKI